MSLHSIAWTFYIISLHSMSFWDPELLLFKIVNPDLIFNFSKLIFKTLGIQNYHFFPFYPQDFWITKVQGKQPGYLDIDFQDFISKLFAKRFQISLQNFLHLLYPYFCPKKKPIFPKTNKVLSRIIKIPKKRSYFFCFYFQINGAGPAFEIASYSDSQVSSYFQARPTRRSHQLANSSV